MPAATRHHVLTAWGTVIIDRSDQGLARLRLPEPGAVLPRAEPLPPDAAGWASLLVAYFTGTPVDLGSIPLDRSGVSAEEGAIYDALRAVPRGETVSYGELAARAGRPGAARAVGAAMARNPWPVVVPCHRVLAKGGALHGFSAPGGLTTKRRLLAMEGVDLDRGAPMLPGLFEDA